VGFLYISDRMLDRGAAPLWIDMRGAHWTRADDYELMPDARRFENWEFSYALLLGMGAAARYALDVGIADAGAYAADLARRARTGLAAIPGARVLDHGRRLGAIVTVELPGAPADEIMRSLREQAIGTTATHRDYAVIDMEAKGALTALRISPHYYNTAREIDIVVGALEEYGAGRGTSSP
jgi:selenocysteine lyase/cysteine desulfurase